MQLGDTAISCLKRGDLVVNNIKLHILAGEDRSLPYFRAFSSFGSTIVDEYTPMLYMGYHHETGLLFYILRLEQDDVLLPEWLFPNVSVVSRFKDAQEVDA